MATTFFGFALADSMLECASEIARESLAPEQAREYLARVGVVSCLNPSHAATIAAMRERFGIEVSIPEKPPQVRLVPGDSLIVMGVRGLPRLTDRHEYSAEEISSASFTFSLYTVLA